MNTRNARTRLVTLLLGLVLAAGAVVAPVDSFAPTEVAQAAPSKTVVKLAKPTLSGVHRVGSYLRVKASTSGSSGTPRLSYAWYRDGKKISGATASKYKLKSRDKGHRIAARVTARLADTVTGKVTAAAKTSAKSHKVRVRAIDDPTSISVVVNKQRRLKPKAYVPSGLVRPSGVSNSSGQLLRSDAAKALTRLTKAAKRDGITITLVSGYRSYYTQQSLFARYAAADGVKAAETYSARAGYSEHQTGLAADLGSTSGCTLGDCFGGTKAGKWLAKNSYKYGFILRYPKGYTNVTGYIYEPWHFRYVGTGTAKAMKKQKVATLEQYRGLKAAPNYL